LKLYLGTLRLDKEAEKYCTRTCHRLRDVRHIFTPFYEEHDAMPLYYDRMHETPTKSSMVHTKSMAAPECHMDLPIDPTRNEQP